jgi:hypothetical protein
MEERSRRSVRGDGSIPHMWREAPPLRSSVTYEGEADEPWRAWFVEQAVEAVAEAHGSLRPAEAAFAEAAVEGVASSRRVRLSNGGWGDPRQERPDGVTVVSRTEIDPAVRLLLVRERGTGRPAAAVVNYGTHPWIFSGPAISAEIAGAVCARTADLWRAPDGPPPGVLWCAGPEGDVTAIWNVNIEEMWKVRTGETAEESVRRRARVFDEELDRLAGLVMDGVRRALDSDLQWDAAARLGWARREAVLPLKEGYETPPEVLLADWQRAAPTGRHLTEVQAVRVGRGVVLGLPGEPFVAIGRMVRRACAQEHLLIAALANDFAEVVYVADRASYELGGYEVDMFPIGPDGGEALVEAAAALLREL